VVRRLTRRLEHLQRSVDALGSGQLSTRVAIDGHDEVASLAGSFNRSAARIEALVEAQRNLLANASHELRSPLARMRMAVELLQERAPPDVRAELVRNMAELDQLVDEILLASRLDAGAEIAIETVDLTGLVAEECAHFDAHLEADAVSLQGNPRLLRRMVRNLLENARRHGGDTPIVVRLAIDPGSTIRLDVIDQGPGVPESERQAIFAPFYRLPGASEREGGVGLGLSLVRQIAAAHGGTVEYMALRRAESCFRVVLLPCCPAQAGEDS
jgi:signal transduction histidine kinase